MADSLLLIDADPDALRVLGDHFARLGYEVGRVSTGAAGFEAFERMRPDVVILDLYLPDQSSLDVLERLRAQGGSVILLTGQGDSEMTSRGMHLGAEHFVTKPVDVNHLAGATARVVEKVRLARQNTLLRESAAALDRLLSAPWPGNVRDMRNVLERAMILARGAGQIGVEHLPADFGRGDGGRRHQPLALADVERAHIERTLRFHGGNRTRSAQELGISRATLINKIKAYGLDL